MLCNERQVTRAYKVTVTLKRTTDRQEMLSLGILQRNRSDQARKRERVILGQICCHLEMYFYCDMKSKQLMESPATTNDEIPMETTNIRPNFESALFFCCVHGNCLPSEMKKEPNSRPVTPI